MYIRSSNETNNQHPRLTLPLHGDHAQHHHQRHTRQRGAKPGVQGGELSDPEGEEGAFAEGWGGGGESLRCLYYQTMSELDGMTVNERLWKKGLLDEYDRAIGSADIPALRQILTSIEIGNENVLAVIRSKFPNLSDSELNQDPE